MDVAARTYTIRMVVIFTAYVGSVIGINLIASSTVLPAPVLVVMSLIPVIPAVLMLLTIVSFVRTRDEVQRRIITESVIWAAGIIGIGTFTYGFLEGAVALPDVSLIWVFPALMAAQGLSLIFVRKRYG